MRFRVRSQAFLSGLRIRRCRELWCRPVAIAPVRPLAWELPYAVGVAQEMAKRQKQTNKQKNPKKQWVNEEIKKEIKKYIRQMIMKTQPLKIYGMLQKQCSEGNS